MKTIRKNAVLSDLIIDLRGMGTKVPFWKAVAKGLSRPARKAFTVNVGKIEKFSDRVKSGSPATSSPSGSQAPRRRR